MAEEKNTNQILGEEQTHHEFRRLSKDTQFFRNIANGLPNWDGFDLKDVANDGDCGYKVLSACLGSTAAQLRLDAMEEELGPDTAEYKSYFEDSLKPEYGNLLQGSTFEEHVASIHPNYHVEKQQSKSYMTDMELDALMTKHNFGVDVFTFDGKYRLQPFSKLNEIVVFSV